MSRRTLYAIGEVALIWTLIFGGIKSYKYCRALLYLNSIDLKEDALKVEYPKISMDEEIQRSRQLNNYVEMFGGVEKKATNYETFTNESANE